MTPAEIIARAFSNAPFPSSRSLTSARRAIEALRAAGHVIISGYGVGYMLRRRAPEGDKT